MGERDTQISRDVGTDVDAGLDESFGDDSLGESAEHKESTARQESAAERESGGFGSRLRARAGGLLSTRSVGIALVLMLVSSFLFGAIPLLGTVGELLGIVAAGFIYGLGTDARRYFELALAGAVAGGGSVLLSNFLFAVFGSGLSIVALGAAGGALAGIVGHYFGRDLRHGLTQDLADGP